MTITAAERYAEGLTKVYGDYDKKHYPNLCKDGPYRVFSTDTPGPRFTRIVEEKCKSMDRCVHAFVENSTGHVYKAEGWKKPAKGIRYTSVESALAALGDGTFSGYLYR